MIITDGLTRTFNGFTAVEDLSLEIKEGEVFGLIGPNGAGKTTTMRMLCCLIKPSQGTATIDGHTIGKEPDAMKIRKIIGLLPESPGVYETLTAYQNLDFYGELHDLDIDVRAKAIERLLKMMDIWERRDETIGTFSRGMKQKISIARALVHDPKYLFLDEPTASLDPGAVGTVREFISRLKKQGRTIFINTHNLDEAERLCDRIGLVDKRLIAVGRPKELAKELWPRRLVITVDNMREDTLARVKGMPGVKEVLCEGNMLKIDVDEPETKGSEITKTLLDDGVKVLSLQEDHHNLEEVYLKYLGGTR